MHLQQVAESAGAAGRGTGRASRRPHGTVTPAAPVATSVATPPSPQSQYSVGQLQGSAGNAVVAGLLAQQRSGPSPDGGQQRAAGAEAGVSVQRAAVDGVSVQRKAAAAPGVSIQRAGTHSGPGGRAPAGEESEQRRPERSGRGVSGPVTGLDVTANSSGMAGGATVSGQYTDPAVSTNASYDLGVGAPAAGAVVAGYGAVTSGSAALTARRERNAAQPGSGEHRAANSEYRNAAGDTAQATSNFAGQVLNGAGGAMNLAGQNLALYNTVLAAGAGAALPAGAIQAGRYVRKGLHAHHRARELKELIIREEIEPHRALLAAREQVVVQKLLIAKLNEDLSDWKGQLAALRAQAEQDPSFGNTDDIANWSPQRRELARQLYDIQYIGLPEIEGHIRSAQQGLDEALADQAQREAYKTALDAALQELAGEVRLSDKGRTRPVSLRSIQLYALYKNRRGRRNKLVQAVSGAAGASGSVAALVSAAAVGAGATAGAAALAATPVGWALAGTAAATGLGLASKDAWHYFAKRWEQTAENHPDGQDDNTLEHLGETLAFWRHAGPNRREEYARVLYEFSADGPAPERVTEARHTLAALGLDWNRLPAEPQAAIKEIARKMVSK